MARLVESPMNLDATTSGVNIFSFQPKQLENNISPVIDIQLFSRSTKLSMTFIMLINVKMATIIDSSEKGFYNIGACIVMFQVSGKTQFHVKEKVWIFFLFTGIKVL